MRAVIAFPFLLVALTAADTIRMNLPFPAETTGVWHFSRASVEIPRGAISPKFLAAPQSSQTKVPSAALVSVSFEINEKGLPINIQVSRSSDKELDDEVIAMIREWRFEAAVKGEFAVPSRAFIDLFIGDLPLEGRRPRKKL